MTTIYFIRHGKTEWNLAARYQGAHGDSPLLEASHQDIRSLAASLAGVKFIHAYTSPLKRARQTAEELIAQLPTPVALTVDERLIEFDLGKMEGMTFSAVEKSGRPPSITFTTIPSGLTQRWWAASPLRR